METLCPLQNDYRCIACNIGFNSFDDQKQHYFIYHSQDNNPNTNLIPKVFPNSGPRKTIAKAINQKKDCEICHVPCASQSIYDSHVKGKKHVKALKKMDATSNDNKKVENLEEIDIVPSSSNVVPEKDMSPVLDLMCRDCSVSSSSKDQMLKHCLGTKHIKIMRMKNFIELSGRKDPSVYCDVCEVFLLDDVMKIHRESGKHKRKCNPNNPIEPERKKRKVDKVESTMAHCGHCKVDLKNEKVAIRHYQSPGHAELLNKANKTSLFPCEACKMSFGAQQVLDMHLKGFKHYVRENKGNANPEGSMSGKLIRMREKLKALKGRKRLRSEETGDKETADKATAEVGNGLAGGDTE